MKIFKLFNYVIGLEIVKTKTTDKGCTLNFGIVEMKKQNTIFDIAFHFKFAFFIGLGYIVDDYNDIIINDVKLTGKQHNILIPFCRISFGKIKESEINKNE
jgi:hypothetical protein